MSHDKVFLRLVDTDEVFESEPFKRIESQSQVGTNLSESGHKSRGLFPLMNTQKKKNKQHTASTLKHVVYA